MSRKSPTGFVTGLIAEVAVIAVVVALLPKVPLGQAAAPAPGSPRENAADRRPTLAPLPEPLPLPDDNWRTAVSRPAMTREMTPRKMPPPDAAYVERRLDRAGQQLVEGVTTYLSRHAQELLQPPPRQQD